MDLDKTLSQEEFDLIEQYLLNTMSDSDRIAFENRLNSDNDLKRKVNDVRALLDGIEIESLKDQLNIFHNDLVNDTQQIASKARVQTIPLPWYKKYAVAASVIILLGLGSIWILSQDSNDKLYANYFKPDPGLPTLMEMIVVTMSFTMLW